MRAVADGCHHLTHLDLHNCKRVTDVGVRQVGVGCPKLQARRVSFRCASANARPCGSVTIAI
jgi:hypothetical protein